MSNLKEVILCNCGPCDHKDVCRFRDSLQSLGSTIKDSVNNEFTADAPFVVNIECQFKKTKVEAPVTPPEVLVPSIAEVQQPSPVVTTQTQVSTRRATIPSPPVDVSKLPPDVVKLLDADTDAGANVKTYVDGVLVSSPNTEETAKPKKIDKADKFELMKKYNEQPIIPDMGASNPITPPAPSVVKTNITSTPISNTK